MKKLDKRKEFIQVYADFFSWLKTLGYRTANLKESMQPDSYFYSEYKKHINPFGGIDIFINDILKHKISFILDNSEHKIMFVGGLCQYSEVFSLEEGKALILKDVKELKEEKLKELNSILV